jgi:hypothetical protein
MSQSGAISLDDAWHDLQHRAMSPEVVARLGPGAFHAPGGNLLAVLSTLLAILRHLPPVDALLDGVPGKVPSEWWTLGGVEIRAGSAATFKLSDGREVRATKIALDREAFALVFRDPPPLSETRAPRRKVTSGDLVRAGWIAPSDVGDRIKLQGDEATPDNAAASPPTERIGEATGTDTLSIERLAEWVFAQHGTGNTFSKLYAAARHDARIGGFTKANLQAAYQRVYKTKRSHPPATGWPLRPSHRERWRDEHS